MSDNEYVVIGIIMFVLLVLGVMVILLELAPVLA